MRAFLSLLLLCGSLLVLTPATQAQVRPIPDTGCRGNGPCDVTGAPGLGQRIQFCASKCRDGLPFLIFGTVGRPILIPSPLACAPAGSGCILACNIEQIFAGPCLTLSIPNDRTLVGQCFCIQCGCVRRPSDVTLCLDLCQALQVCVTP